MAFLNSTAPMSIFMLARLMTFSQVLFAKIFIIVLDLQI